MNDPAASCEPSDTRAMRATGDKEIALRARSLSSPQQADGVFSDQFYKINLVSFNLIVSEGR